MCHLLRRCNSFAEMQSAGDYVTLPDKGVVMICPGCGNWIEVGGPNCYPHQVISKEPLTLSPSVVCPWKLCHYVVSAGRC